ncbi:MAG: signal peptidase I [Chromatiales bacterium]|jgi:signal peptidase I|nr:signal peptidase I [Chromatiales bacterium]HJP03677.1 signal peptidase I [Gammaproteobacteria bacterium]
MDFALVLVILTGLSGLVCGAEFLFRRIADAENSEPSKNIAVDYSRSFFPVLLLVLIVRSFLFEPFRIPSSSMVPTLLVGDFIFVNKYTYGLRLPVLHSKIMDIGEPERGDVIVFRLPSDPSVNYIKRLVGLPGDTIAHVNKRLYINDKLVALEQTDIESDASSVIALERLGKVEHNIRLMRFKAGSDGKYIVPAGHYFMMGDNRDNSQDSRFPQVGYVPQENIVGKAVRVWMNWDFPESPQWVRIGNKVE